MNQEIKLVAWDNEKNHMIDEIVYIDFRAKQVGCHRSGYGSYCQPFENIIFRKYTGLKDKNGNEIYEGDILKCKVKDGFTEGTYDYKYKYVNNVIEWWESTTQQGYRLRHGKFTMMLKKYALVTMESEVIGNVYENPKLLQAA